MTDVPPPLDRGLRELLDAVDRAIDPAPPTAAIKAGLRSRIATTIGGGAAGVGAGTRGLGAVKKAIIGVGGAAAVTAAWFATHPRAPSVLATPVAIIQPAAPAHPDPHPDPSPRIDAGPTIQLAAGPTRGTPVAHLPAAPAIERPRLASPSAAHPSRIERPVEATATVATVAPPEPVAAVPAPDLKPATSVAETAEPPPAPARPADARPSARPPVEGPDELALEGRILEDARRALRAHAPARALARLRDHATRFADGKLAEEREVLAVQALVASGNLGAARARATTFRTQFPSSIFLDLIEELLPKLDLPSPPSEAP